MVGHVTGCTTVDRITAVSAEMASGIGLNLWFDGQARFPLGARVEWDDRYADEARVESAVPRRGRGSDSRMLTCTIDNIHLRESGSGFFDVELEWPVVVGVTWSNLTIAAAEGRRPGRKVVVYT